MSDKVNLSEEENNDEELKDVGAEFVYAPEGEYIHKISTNDFTAKALRETFSGKQLRIQWDSELPREEQAQQIKEFAAEQGVRLTDEQINDFIDQNLKNRK